MTFSVAEVSASYIEADGAPQSEAAVTFTISETISNGGVTLAAGTTTTVQADASGNVSQQVVSTLDPGTAPQGALWRIDERVGTGTRTWFTPMPSGAVSLESLSPFVNGPPSPGGDD